jgi:beta-galactosidase GanA
MRTPAILFCLLLAAACGPTDPDRPGAGDPSADGGKDDDGGGGGGGRAHVEIRGGELLIDGEPTFLYGGEVQYFRVRAADFDADETHRMWAETLDTMKAAGMNLVTTYAAWDYHQIGPDQWDFTGARDVGAFIDMACDKGFYVIYKPGPLITAEWPRGFGSFGAVPEWWKAAHPETLMKKANGDYYSYSPTGDDRQRQPTYLHPTYLDAVRTWYQKSLEIVRPHLGGCLIGLQIDNETNFYWSNRFGDVDYSETALAHYADWLAARYGSIGALNAAYGTSYTRFDQVEPPTSAPGSAESERARNVWYADWYWAGQAYIADYLAILRDMMEELGFAEPDVMFHTNDSPFTLLFEDFQLRQVNIHDGPTKNQVGLATLDLYSKQFPTNDSLHEQPFQPDYYTRLYDHYGDLYTGSQDYTYAAELQGGFYPYPVVGHPTVRPESTDQLLARTIGRGLKGASFYVYRDGLNADGSDYSYQSAIAADGSTTPRYQVARRWGQMLAREGRDLLRAAPVRNRVAIVQNGLYAAPQGGVLDNMQRLYTQEYPALFGWLTNAGIDPDVVDSRLVSAADLADYAVVFYLNPDFVDDRTAAMLTDYVAAGGVLVNLLWPGRVNERFAPSPATDALAALFPARADGYWQWKNTSRAGRFNLELGGGSQTTPLSFWYETFWRQPTDGAVEPFAWERSALGGGSDAIVGYVARDGAGTRAFLGTNIFSRFNQGDYYDWDPADIAEANRLARWLVDLGGEGPLVSAGGVRELVWARRAPDKLFLFVVNDNADARTVDLRLADGQALGIRTGATYRVRDALADRPLGEVSGADLLAGGLSIELARWGTAVITIAGPR